MKSIGRRPLLATLGVVVVGAVASAVLWPEESDGTEVTLYKSPECECCGGYVTYLRRNGYKVNVQNMDDVAPIKERWGVPSDLWSCHTSKIGDYVIEGHVPVASLQKLLAERPAIQGLALPGMFEGSPGMSGAKSERWVIHSFAKGRSSVFHVI